MKQANHVSGRQILIKFCFKIKRGDGLLQAFSWKYTVCIHCLYTVCIRKPYLGYLCSCMRSVYEKRQDTVYMHCIHIGKFRLHRQISRNFAALRAQANLKSKLIEHAFTPMHNTRGNPVYFYFMLAYFCIFVFLYWRIICIIRDIGVYWRIFVFCIYLFIYVYLYSATLGQRFA